MPVFECFYVVFIRHTGKVHLMRFVQHTVKGSYIIRLGFAGSLSANATTRTWGATIQGQWGATIQGPGTATLPGGAATTSTE